ncbi:hypothetical protein LOK74_12370 [Brevibacillus humidisoli]|uniref:hypothetical protein n=1 Tax=Brevibacillus humidisoli TaxID=2895522 RepID=UPI001E547131|nr:hypothetical protein [Brevibacillus humidisoli]UFJ38880.1 hypothetical protein LOK74_12370 [Brevibacillus humidisoli]
MNEAVMELMQRDLDNDLSDEEKEQLHHLLSKDPELQLAYDRLKRVSAELADLPPVSPPFSLVDAILAQAEPPGRLFPDTGESAGQPTLPRLRSKETAVSIPPRRSFPAWVAKAGTGVIAASLLFGLFLLANGGGDADRHHAAPPEQPSTLSPKTVKVSEDEGEERTNVDQDPTNEVQESTNTVQSEPNQADQQQQPPASESDEPDKDQPVDRSEEKQPVQNPPQQDQSNKLQPSQSEKPSKEQDDSGQPLLPKGNWGKAAVTSLDDEEEDRADGASDRPDEEPERGKGPPAWVDPPGQSKEKQKQKKNESEKGNQKKQAEKKEEKEQEKEKKDKKVRPGQDDDDEDAPAAGDDQREDDKEKEDRTSGEERSEIHLQIEVDVDKLIQSVLER